MEQVERERLLRIDEAAKILRISKQKCYALAKQGIIPNIQIGEQSFRVRESDLYKWIAEQRLRS